MYGYKPSYPDRYDPSSNLARILPVPGRALQAAELLEMQSLVVGAFHKALSPLYRSGAILEGLTSYIANTTLYVTAGYLYVDGIPVSVPSANFPLVPTESYVVEVVVSETIITEEEDPSLRDPIGGAEYGLEGAHRLLWKGALTLRKETDPPLGYPIASIREGQLLQVPSGPLRQLSSEMARGSYDRWGNFLLSGLSVSYVRSVTPQLSTTSPAALAQVDDLIRRVRLEIDSLSGAKNAALAAGIPVSTYIEEGLQAAQTQLAALLTDRNNLLPPALPVEEYLSISPGSAYLGGYRLDINSPVSLIIERKEFTLGVESASYTYGGAYALSTHTFTGEYISLAQQKSLTLEFIGLLPESSIIVKIPLSPPGITLEELLNRIDNALDPGIPGVTYQNVEGVANLPAILNAHIAVVRTGARAITFMLRYASSLRGIVSVKLTLPEGLLVDIYEAPLLPPPGALINNRYELVKGPVASIRRLVADIDALAIPISRSSAPTDELPDDTIKRITQVVQGTLTYVAGVDYYLRDASHIEWLPLGRAPSLGTTYFVSFVYTQPMTLGEDFILSGDAIIFTGRTPSPLGTFTVDYDYYLSQAALVYLKSTGEIDYSLSSPSLAPVPPPEPPDSLSLAGVYLRKGKPSVVNIAPPRMTAKALWELFALCRKKSLSSTIKTPFENVDEERSRCAFLGYPPSALTLPTRVKEVPLRYLSGGQKIHRTLTLPWGPDRSYSWGLYQERATRSYLLSPNPSPSLSIEMVPLPLDRDGDPIPDRDYNNLDPQLIAQFSSSYEDGYYYPLSYVDYRGKYVLTIEATGLLSTASYNLFVDNQAALYEVTGGLRTALGVRPIMGNLRLTATIQLQAGMHLLELRPTAIGSPSVRSPLHVYSPGDRQAALPLGTTTEIALSQSYYSPLDFMRQEFEVTDPIYVCEVALRLKTMGPDGTLYVLLTEGETILTRGKVENANLSLNASAITEISFREPVLILPGRVYSLAIYSSENVEIYGARLGEKDLLRGSYSNVAGQLYGGGHLHLLGGRGSPDEDLTYSMKVCRFLTAPEVVLLGEYGAEDGLPPLFGMALSTRDILPPGTQVVYSVSVPYGTGWEDIIPNSLHRFKSPLSSFKLRGTLYTSSSRLSPSLDLSGAVVTLFSSAPSGYYESKGFISPPGANRISVTLERTIPPGGSLAVSILPTLSSYTLPLLPVSSVSLPGGEWVREVYEGELPSWGETSYRLDMASGVNGIPVIRYVSHLTWRA